LLKHERIRFTTAGEEAFGVTLPRSENRKWGWVGRLKLSRANSPTGLIYEDFQLNATATKPTFVPVDSTMISFYHS